VRRIVLLTAAALALPACAEHYGLCDPVVRVPWSRIRVDALVYPSFREGRQCLVYLPPGYDQSTARYPVLYMLDGELLFGRFNRWYADQTLEDVIERHQIEPIIVVGIFSPQNDPRRAVEYTPWRYFGYPAPGGGGGGGAFLHAVADTLIPEVNRRFRTLTGPAHTYLAGASLGGLLAAYAAYDYDTTFSRIAAISPSYWWDGDTILAFARSRPKPSITRFYQGNGTGNDQQPGLLAEMESIAVGQGVVVGQDFLHVEAPGQNHDPGCWGRRFPDALRFLIDPPPKLALRP